MDDQPKPVFRHHIKTQSMTLGFTVQGAPMEDRLDAIRQQIDPSEVFVRFWRALGEPWIVTKILISGSPVRKNGSYVPELFTNCYDDTTKGKRASLENCPAWAMDHALACLSRLNQDGD